jgi:flagellar hook-associated protein 2
LSVTALKENSSVVVNVSSDTAKVKTAISDFLTEYNKLQTMIDTETASSTDSKGKVTAGTLSGEMDAYDISSQLRKAAYTQVEGLSGVLDHLEDIGIVSNGDDNTLKVSDSEKLDDALANNMGSVQTLFTDSSKGIAIQLADYLDRMIGDEGSLVTKQSNLTAQSANIDTQIADMERIVESNRQRLIGSFVAMETVQAKINQQLQFLQQRFGSTK